MRRVEFERIVEERIHLIRLTLSAKGMEYGREDRLHNFKRAAAILAKTPEEALVGMLVKHIVSVLDIIETGGEREEFVKKSFIQEKIGDSINYLILLEALLLEHHDLQPLGRHDDESI